MSEKVLKEAATLCLDNAEQYIKDAEALVKISSYGHAFALAVLAEEELAKAYVCYFLAEGGLMIKGRWRKILSQIKERFEITKFIVSQPLSPSDKIQFKNKLEEIVKKYKTIKKAY